MFYEELWSLYDDQATYKGYSGFAPEEQMLPYLSLVNTAHTVTGLQSTLAQEEQYLYSYVSYGRSYSQVKTILDLLKDDNDSASFSPADAKLSVLNLEWGNSIIEELEPNLFGGILSIELNVERQPDLVKIADRDLTSYDDIFKAIKVRWDNYKTGSQPDMYLGTYVPEENNLPRLIVAGNTLSNESYETCARNQDRELNLNLFDRSLSAIETLVNDLVNVFNFSKFVVTNYTNQGVEFISCSFEEVEPNIWMSRMGFSVGMGENRTNFAG